MKTEFASSWISSVQPRKQRKYRINAPQSVRHKLISAHLSKELREKHGRRSFPVRKGDTVKVLRGDFSGKEGTVERVDMTKLKLVISGCEVVRVNGQKKKVLVDPSNVVFTNIKLDDKLRKQAMSRAKKGSKEE